MTTLEKVQAQIAKLQARAEALAVKQSSGVIAKIRDIMEKHGLTTTDIEAHIGGSKKRGRKPGVKVEAKSSATAAKYRDPKSGATWTGHGRAPAWISKAKDRSKFLIEGNAFAAAPAAKKDAKAGNYVRGPQAPKYRDPKSGATWSGRGRAPAWLAEAKDRTKFLIAEAGGDTAEPKAVTVKKAGAATRPAAKKRVVKNVSAPAKKAPAKKAAAKKKIAVKRGTKKTVARKAPVSAVPSAPATAPEASAPTASA
ncbi:H-NS family nucleoid-associated regulatory protein [Paraburkholderia sp. C35]|uniref:H-NS family nucleoid-associated regulatory protein n=1 Tax=Paraburkholderia sp. C35 TaxID=2126993 RepID=UPI000D6978F1|nr:H-NS family nucleoid-associated regulatory protein [Paraburkholderia sp. C35]